MAAIVQCESCGGCLSQEAARTWVEWRACRTLRPRSEASSPAAAVSFSVPIYAVTRQAQACTVCVVCYEGLAAGETLYGLQRGWRSRQMLLLAAALLAIAVATPALLPTLQSTLWLSEQPKTFGAVQHQR